MKLAAFFIPALFAIADLLLRFGVARRYTFREWGYFGASVLYSFLAHQAILFLLSRLRGGARFKTYLLMLGGTALLYTLAGTLSYAYYFETGIMPNAYTFEYVRMAAFNSATLIRDAFRWYHILAVAGVLGIFTAAINAAAKRPLIPHGKFGKAIHALSVIVLALFFNNNVRFVDQCFVADVNLSAFTLREVYKSFKNDRFGSTGLLAHQGAPLPDSLGRPRFNVLWIVGESLRRQSLGIFGYERETTPRLRQRIKADSASFFLFKSGFSNATRTLLSVPSILTGASPAQPGRFLHHLPFIWEYAKPLGYSTFFIASHSHDWYNYKVYFTSPAIDYLWNRELSGLPAVNDLGVDDEKTVTRFSAHADSLLKAGKHFCGVLHLNTNHFPYHTPDSFARWNGGRRDQYDNSVLYQDHLLETVFKTLEKAGVLDSTVIFFTSDHGEGFGEHGFNGHVESNYIEVLAVPQILFLPPAIRTPEAVVALRTNEELPTCNLDLMPTLLDLWKVDENPAVAPLRGQMLGTSFLTPVDPLRDIIACDNNEVSRYKKGLSLIRGPWHYVLQVNTLPLRQELYRYDEDAWETKDLWPGLGDDEKASFHRAFAPFPNCREVFTKWKVSFLGER